MGNYLLLLIAGLILAGLFYTAMRGSTMVETEAVVANIQYDALARNAAVGGHELVTQALVDNFVDQDIRGTRDGAKFTATAVVDGVEAQIVSTGSTLDADGDIATYVIHVQVERGVPPALEFALMAMNNIVLNGNISVFSLHPKRNANVHTNSDLRLNGTTSLVEGFGTYSGSLHATAHQISGVFQPNYNPRPDPLVAHRAPVPISMVDPAAVAAGIDLDNVTVGTATISGSYSLGGTRNDPYVWFVNGDLDVADDVTIDGYTMFLVTGDIDLNANVDAAGVALGESTIAFYTGSDVNVGGGKDLEAQVFANGQIWFHGNSRVFGNIASADGAKFSGDVEIHYLPASAGLTHQVWSDYKGVLLVGYNEQ